jgi:thioredoxin 2
MILKCPECHTRNRVPAERLGESPKCGECKETLTSSRAPVDVDDDELQAAIAHSPLPVFVDFWAPWCGPCKMVAPQITRLAERNAGELLVLKINTQDHPQAAARYGVQGIPMFALFRDGSMADKAVGAMSAEQLESSLGLD